MRESWLIAVERFLDHDVTNARSSFNHVIIPKKKKKKKKEKENRSMYLFVHRSAYTWNFVFSYAFLLRKSFVFLIF